MRSAIEKHSYSKVSILPHLDGAPTISLVPRASPWRKASKLLIKKTKPIEPEPSQAALKSLRTPPLPTPVASPTLLLVDERLKLHAHPDGRRHPECPERLVRVREALETSGLLARCKVMACGDSPSDAELRAVHSPFYLQRLTALQKAPRERIEAEALQYDSIFMNEHSVHCAMLAAGGVLSMARQIHSGAARNGMALVRPAGHHADANGPSGFCLLNSLAVSAKQLLSEGCERIMIVDWDIHHGDGTQKVPQAPFHLHLAIPYVARLMTIAAAIGLS